MRLERVDLHPLRNSFVRDMIAVAGGLPILVRQLVNLLRGQHTALFQNLPLLRRERLGAVLTGSDRQVSLDGERRVLVGDSGGIIVIPRDVDLEVLGIDALWSGRQAVVRFTPDGASTGAVLKLSREKAEYEIRVNWYTGGVAIAP